MTVSNLSPKLKRLKLAGHNCPCCLDTGRHFGFGKYVDCDRCNTCELNNKILHLLPSTCGDMSSQLNVDLPDIKNAVEILHNCKRVKFKNNGKNPLMVMKVDG